MGHNKCNTERSKLCVNNNNNKYKKYWLSRESRK